MFVDDAKLIVILIIVFSVAVSVSTKFESAEINTPKFHTGHGDIITRRTTGTFAD